MYKKDKRLVKLEGCVIRGRRLWDERPMEKEVARRPMFHTKEKSHEKGIY